MSRAPVIHFESPPWRGDRVTLAVVPVDGFSGAIVTSGIAVSVRGRPDRPIRNASGMLVFLNLPESLPDNEKPTYIVDIDAGETGFYDPEPIEFIPPEPDDPDSERKRRREALLIPRPDYSYPGGSTLLRGVLVTGAAPAVGATVRVRPDLSDGDFVARADGKGAFTLALRPSPLSKKKLELDIHFHFAGGAHARTLKKSLSAGRNHSFLEPIDLKGANNPDFYPI